ncbi:MAG: MFS transporter [Planctomycetaceae bacterium]|nr:MFS transporter [Planctomycetaceae bacterium]
MTETTGVSPLSTLVRWRIVLMLMGFAALGHFNRVGISVAGSEIFIQQYGISEVEMGWVYTTFLIVYTIGMLPGGWIIDRLGAALTLTFLGLSMGAFTLLTGTLGWINTAPAGLWLGLMVIRGLAGVCSAPLHPGAAHVVSDLMSDRGRATANGMVTAGALIGIACSYPIFGWLMDRLSWPWAFVVSGMALAAYGLLWSRCASPSLPGPHSATSVEEAAAHTGNDWSLLLHGNLWLLTLSYAAYGYFQYLFFYWMSYYFESVLHVPDIESRRAAFWIMLAQGAGMAIGGLSTDAVCRWLGTLPGRRSIVMTGMGLGAVFGLLGVSVSGQWNVAVCLAISMGALGMCEGVFWTTATDIGGKSRGFSGAFMNTGGNVGGLISPVLTPVMAEQIGWSGAIAVACVISGLGGAVWFLIKTPAKG